MKRLALWLLPLLLLAAAPFAAAQDDPKDPPAANDDGDYVAFDLDDDTLVPVPADWDDERERGGDGHYFYSDDLTLYVLGPVGLDDLLNIRSSDTAQDVFDDFVAERIGDDFDAESERVREDGRLVEWFYGAQQDGEEIEGTWYIIEVDDGAFVHLDIWGPPGAVDDAEDVVDVIVEGTLSQALPDAPAEDEAETDDEDGGAATGEACTVRAPAPDTVQMRVGPGFNRSVFAFLPAGRDFEVLGQAEADDGSLWYQLDKDEAAPNNAVNEVWVAAADVETEGDCDAVGEADAPPIVPIVPRAATPAPGGDNGGDSTPPPSNEGLPQPRSGTWTLTFGDTVTASCQDTETVRFPAAAEPPRTGYVTITPSSITFADGVLTLIEPGVYQGTYNFGDGSNQILTLRIVSETLLVGRADFNFALDDGTRCSGGIDATLSR